MKKLGAAAIVLLLAAIAVGTVFFVLSKNEFKYSYNDTGIVIEKYKGHKLNVNIPDNIDGIPVTEIGNGAFMYYGSDWKHFDFQVTIPDSVKIIGDEAFNGCKTLKLTRIPKSVEYIGYRAFNGTPLDEAAQNAGVDMFIINDRLLYRYNGDSPKPIIPQNITAVCGGAFMDKNTESIEIPENVKYMGGMAFAGCERLESITLPADARLCGEGAFKGCKSLKYAKLGCEEMPDFMFYGCEALAKLDFTDAPRKIGNMAFGDCISLESFDDENAVEVGNGAFSNCTALKTVNLPNTVDFGHDAFRGSGIESIEIADGTKNIQWSMFEECKALKSVKLPPSIENIGDEAFFGCKALKNIKLSDGLTKIGGKAFANTGLEQFEMPNTVNEIGSSAFWDCKSLKSIRFSTALGYISTDCCNDCTALESVVLPPKLKNIGTNAFWKDKSLEHIDLPDGLEKIDMNAFMDTGIWEVFIPDSVNDFNRQAFCCDDHGVLIMHTANCAAAGQIEQARQWGIVHDRYYVNVVRSRSEEEEIYNSSKNN